MSGCYSLATIELQKSQIQQSERLLGGTEMGRDIIASAKASFEQVIPLQANVIITGLLCVIGAFLMRKLNKTGFYIYTIAASCSVIIPIYLTGLGEGVVNSLSILVMVITFSFIVMYAFNLKFMS